MGRRDACTTTSRAAIWAAGIAFLMAALVLPGCNDEPPPKDPEAASTENDAVDFGCGDRLDAALTMLHPDRLGIITDAETAVTRLNLWLEACGVKIDVADAPGGDLRPLLEQALPSAELNRLTAGRFVAGDAAHVRNCRLHKAIATLELGSPESDVERIVALFHYCVRNVALHASPAEALPLTPYEILLFGRGSAEDVAWVFADALRQLQIDAVILRPAATSPAADAEGATAGDAPWLVGVLLENEVYLFDPKLGTPIPSAADDGMTATVQQPATLSQVQQDDGLLRRLDLSPEEPYPLTAGQLKRLKAEVIGTRSLWSPSMARLQASLSGERSMVVFDGLQDFGDAPGLIARVAESGGTAWTKQDVAIWPYPERQLAAAQRLSEAERRRMSQLELPLDAPIPVTVDAVAQVMTVGAPQNRHILSRTTYMMGNLDAAVSNFQSLRIQLVTAARHRLPDEIRAKHERAGDDAAYWVGLCQMEREQYESAVSTFRDYLRRYRDRSEAAWMPHCRLMLGLALAETGDFGEATFELRDPEQTPEPLRARQRFWVNRWNAARETAAEE
jgi:hypothetical protein